MAQDCGHDAGSAQPRDAASSLRPGLLPKPQGAGDRGVGPAPAARDVCPEATEAQAHASRSCLLGCVAQALASLERHPGDRQTGHCGSLAPEGLPPLYWRVISKRGPGRPPVSEEVQGLIRRFALENGWGTRKVHAELEKLGFTLGLATVSRYFPKKPPNQDQRQRWVTFLHNHKDVIAAMDFLVVPTVSFRLLYVWFVIGRGRRRILHFNVTMNPTAQWVRQQLRESFPGNSAPRYLLFDNDSLFSDDVSQAIRLLGITPTRTAYRSPCQSGTAERWLGSCRREILDHVIVFNAGHLRRLLCDYVAYYNAERVHTVIRDAPEGRTIEARPSPDAKVVGLPRIGGLHHRYVWQEAA